MGLRVLRLSSQYALPLTAIASKLRSYGGPSVMLIGRVLLEAALNAFFHQDLGRDFLDREMRGVDMGDVLAAQ